jgi:hypothetical protein
LQALDHGLDHLRILGGEAYTRKELRADQRRMIEGLDRVTKNRLVIKNYPRSFFAASLTARSLTFPVSFRIVPSVALGENSGIGFGRFLLRVSLRFC